MEGMFWSNILENVSSDYGGDGDITDLIRLFLMSHNVK